jgi:excisionase family DNA binding protein
MDPYLSACEVADRLAVSRSWVYKHKRALGAVHVGDRMWRFPESSIQAYLYTHASKLKPTREARQPEPPPRRQWRLDY